MIFSGRNKYTRGGSVWAMVCVLLFLSACKPEELPPPDLPDPGPDSVETAYSFFVAGHTYGNFASTAYGLHPPFRNDFPYIRDYPGMEFGVLTGDVVKWASPARWDSVDRDLQALNGLPVYIAAGNHDLDFCAGQAEFEARFGPRNYFFTRGKDVFVVWDVSCQGWNIWEDQLAMLNRAVSSVKGPRNVFIFVHQIMWFDLADSRYGPRYLAPNSRWGRMDASNFFSVTLPALQGIPGKVWVFAGDTGAWCSGHELTWHVEENVNLISSGMGCETRGNYLIVSVLESGEMQVELRGATGDPQYDPGTLRDYLVR